MEYDRYQNNHALYIVGLVSLLSSLVFIGFSLYLLPYLIWGLNYTVPYFIVYCLTLLQEDYLFSPGMSKLLVFILFIVPGCIASFITYIVSNRIDNQFYQEKPQREEESLEKELERKAATRESILLSLRLLVLMVLLVSTILFIYSLI